LYVSMYKHKVSNELMMITKSIQPFSWHHVQASDSPTPSHKIFTMKHNSHFPISIPLLSSILFLGAHVQKNTNLKSSRTKTATTAPLPPQVTLVLEKAQADNQRLVLMTCGLSGAGKSTLARSICTHYPNFTRLSIDASIFQNHGVFAIDYPESKYSALQDEAREWVRSELGRLLKEGKRDAVHDLSLWERAQREEWRALVKCEGKGMYGVVLVACRGEEGVIWERIQKREQKWEREGMGEGRPVDRELLGKFLEGFEWPEGEGEIVVEVE
jgi:predicted kinase